MERHIVALADGRGALDRTTTAGEVIAQAISQRDAFRQQRDGTVQGKARKLSSILRHAQVPSLQRLECQERLRLFCCGAEGPQKACERARFKVRDLGERHTEHAVLYPLNRRLRDQNKRMILWPKLKLQERSR